LRRRYLLSQDLLAVVAGLVLGIAAWGEGRAPTMAVALPLAIALCRSRAQGFLFGAAYTAGLLRHTVLFIGGWFDGSIAIGLLAVTGYAVVSGAVWCLGWSRSESAWIRAAAVCLAWCVALLPPAALVVPGHPLIAMGYLLPGSGWVGAATSLIGPAAAVGLCAHWRIDERKVLMACGVMLTCLAAAGALHARVEPRGASPLQAISTGWGRISGEDAALARIAEMGSIERSMAPSQPATIVWPESIIGQYAPSMFPVLELELLRPARRSGRTHVVGMDVSVHGAGLLNSAVAFYPDGSSATATARQPAPVALWRPWTGRSFVADWTSRNVLPAGDGAQAAIIFCYEEYIPLLYLLNEVRDAPTLYVAMSNTWAAQDATADVIQGQHSQGIAKLFGRPYFRAVNRPAP
jgi:hypothetical protein